MRDADELVLFLDRNLGSNIIANALREAGHRVEIHDAHLANDAPDEDWIRLISNCSWVGLTKDRHIRSRASERNTIIEYGARVIIIRAKNLTGQMMAEFLVRHHDRIRNFVDREDAPFIAGINLAGKISRYYL